MPEGMRDMPPRGSEGRADRLLQLLRCARAADADAKGLISIDKYW